MTSKFKTFVFLFLFILLIGCITIPTSENKVLSGEKITDKQLVFIEHGITSKSDIIDQLGHPDVHLIDKNIFAYDWQTRQAIMIFYVPYGMPGAVDIPKNYVLLIRFDVEDIVRNHAITKRSLLESYGDHLIEWIQENEKSE